MKKFIPCQMAALNNELACLQKYFKLGYCNYILFTKLPCPGDSEGTLWFRVKLPMHYHELLKDNKGDSNKIWKIVNELSSIKTKARVDPTELITENGKILTNSDEIAESLNEHFVNIGPKMAESISSADLDGISYTKSFTSTKINNSFFLAPSTTNEIINIIDSLSAKRQLDLRM